MEYLFRAVGTWFLGFFPLAEIYIAVPAGVASGLDDVSVIFWAVLGNFLPVLLVHYGYAGLIQPSRFGRWLAGRVSDSARERVNRYGVWFVLVFTPWTGVWLMAVTAKLAGMNFTRFMWVAFASILIYAVGIVVLIRAGLMAVS
ncbi:MAG: hypothetical protein EA396_10690 [Anaerolineaceae bacterium]|nr:MAG: hypothetical protein EA396_10690 [Anaerolineaceae bacterium]